MIFDPVILLSYFILQIDFDIDLHFPAKRTLKILLIKEAFSFKFLYIYIYISPRVQHSC